LTSILNKEHHSGLDRLAKLAARGELTPEVLTLTAFRRRSGQALVHRPL
jgi:hypothetical protein